MHFLADVYVECDICKGKRYNRETLEIKYKGRSIHEVLDMSVRLGVNEGGGIQFSNADPAKALERARSNAVKDAMDKARGLASAAGGKVGRVLEISEHNQITI